MKKILVHTGVIVVWLMSIWIPDRWNKNLYVWFLDVGQGDAILIRTPDRKYILVDGGGGDYVLGQLGEVMPPWVRHIDIVILTHPHADHFKGLLDIMERYRVGEIWWNPVYYPNPEYITLIEMTGGQVSLRDSGENRLRNAKIRPINVQKGMVWRVGGVEIQVLWPLGTSGGENSELPDKELIWCSELGIECNTHFDENLNNDSVVIYVTFGEFGLLLTGDAEVEVEEKLIQSGLLYGIDVDVLKAGHHCSRTASSEAFLEMIKPELAICSCGEGNKFGHPHEETIDLFKERGIEWFRTDVDGRVRIITNGRRIQLNSVYR